MNNMKIVYIDDGENNKVYKDIISDGLYNHKHNHNLSNNYL